MWIDATALQDGQQLEAEIAIVGAGGAGILLAKKLAEAGRDVLLLDSGGKRFDPQIQLLSDAHELDTSRHPTLSECTRLQLGGTSVTWGGRCVPFDPIDFEARPYIPHSGWPISYADVQPYMGEVCQFMRCGEPIFDIRRIDGIKQHSLVPGLEDGDVRTTTIERWSVMNYGRYYLAELIRHPKIRVLGTFTCTEVVAGQSGEAVEYLQLRSLDGRSVIVRPSICILASGGLNTTKLLLNSDRMHPGGLGNQHGNLGRYYAGHISGRIAQVHFTTDPRKTIYGFDRDSDGVYLRRRFSFSPETLHRNEMGNIVCWLANPQLSDAGHGNGVLSFAYLLLAGPMGKYLAPEAIRKAAVKGANSSMARHILNMFKDLPRTLHFMWSFGYGRYFADPRVPGFFQFSKSNMYDLHYFGEQIPDPQSTVSLSDERDAIGMRRIRIDHRYGARDYRNVRRCHELIDRHLQQQGIGRLVFQDNLEEQIAEQASDGFHQTGTTRMSVDPRDGVVDADCRVHGIENLYVASSSVFVTASQANSMFTILLLASRLGEHLKK
jgi:hypothetical protein